jgi:hypothetical protein
MALTLAPRSLGYEQAYNLYTALGANAAVVGYVTIGRQTAWANDAAPPDILNTDQEIFQAYNAILGGKIVTGSDVALVIPRVNWTTATVYTAYDDTSTTLFNSTNTMYVLTATSEVYKCISNANNAPSTVQPSTAYIVNNGFSSALGDGYVWKYLYKVPSGSKFLTNDWMPIPSYQDPGYTGSANNAVDGAISRLVLVSGGSSYSQNTTQAVVAGGGVAANVTVTVTGGAVSAVTLVNRGSGYDRGLLNVSIIGAGTGANVRTIGSPYRGHAYNPARELGANSCMIAVQIGATGDATEGGKITSNNEFRQVGLLLRPHSYGSNNSVNTGNAILVFSQLTQAVLTAGGAYTVDELVYQGADSGANATFTGYVTETFSNAINMSNIRGTLRVGLSLAGVTSGVTRTVVSVVTPDMDRASGSLVYVENRLPITRSAGHA